MGLRRNVATLNVPVFYYSRPWVNFIHSNLYEYRHRDCGPLKQLRAPRFGSNEVTKNLKIYSCHNLKTYDRVRSRGIYIYIIYKTTLFIYIAASLHTTKACVNKLVLQIPHVNYSFRLKSQF